jgi:hypothetical protein
MDRLLQPVTPFPNEQMLKVWEDMRLDVLHELQEGASVPDELIDLMGDLAVMLRAPEAGAGSGTIRQRA